MPGRAVPARDYRTPPLRAYGSRRRFAIEELTPETDHPTVDTVRVMIRTMTMNEFGRKAWRAVAVPLLLLAGMVLAKSINLASFAISDRIMPYVSGFDADGAFLNISIHHVVQLAFAIALIAMAVALVPTLTWQRFGFTMYQARVALRNVGLFVIVWSVIQFGVGYLIVANGVPADPGFPLSARNIAGVLGFQLLLSGTSEEVLFRGLIMTMMMFGWTTVIRADATRRWSAIAGSTLVFMFDHVNFSLAPLAVTHLNVLQLGTVMLFGLFYGYLFSKTGSLFGPIVAHGVLNCIIVASGVVLSAVAAA